MAGPLFSIITPTFNRSRYLGAAIESVRAQEFADFEHIIVDGGSTDETPALLARHLHLRVLSEPDRGLYDAINKGLRLARGEVIGVLNSDDLYAPALFTAVAAAFGDSAIDVVTGRAEFFIDATDGAQPTLWELTTEAQLEFTLSTVLAGVPALNARFFRRRLVERVGQFDLTFEIAADRDWLVRAALLQPRGIVLSQRAYRYRQHNESLTLHDSDRNIARYLSDHVAFAGRHLASAALREDERRALRRFHAHESASLAVLSLRSGGWREAWEWAQRGCRENAAWPLAFCRQIAAHLLGRTPASDLARRASRS